MKAVVTAFAAAFFAAAPAAACTLPSNAAQIMADAGAAMNAKRAAAGRPALDRHGLLDKAAQDHACWMADNNTFSHIGAGGSKPKRRIKAAGYSTRLAAENIALGQTTGAQVISTWMGSSGHRQNILRSGVDDYGIGVAVMQGQTAWVMVFAQD